MLPVFKCTCLYDEIYPLVSSFLQPQGNGCFSITETILEAVIKPTTMIYRLMVLLFESSWTEDGGCLTFSSTSPQTHKRPSVLVIFMLVCCTKTCTHMSPEVSLLLWLLLLECITVIMVIVWHWLIRAYDLHRFLSFFLIVLCHSSTHPFNSNYHLCLNPPPLCLYLYSEIFV